MINNGNVTNNGSGGGGDSQYTYKGTYNADTNTPTLTNGVGTLGDWYLVVVAGTNNPTGEMLAVNQVIAYNGAIWQAGGQIDNSDEIVVASTYAVIMGQTIQVGQSLTLALGILEGEIDSLATSIALALNGKQNLVTGATNDNLAALDATGQAKDSGIAKSVVTKQGNTFNGNSQLVQTTSTGNYPALAGNDIVVINPTGPSPTALSVALENIFMSIPLAQVNADWNATTGVAQILNKPNVLTNPMTTAGDMIVGGSAGAPTRLGKGTANQVLSMVGANLAWAANPALYQYSKYRYVDNVGGSDTNQGSFNAPYKTVAYALTQITTGMIICLLGQTAEPALSIPATLTNIDVISFGTRSALNGFTNGVTVLGTGAGSVRFQNLNFGGGLTRASTSKCGIYVYGGSIGTAGFTQSGNGYTEFVETDASNGPNAISAGRLVTNGGKLIAPVVTGSGTFVSINNAGSIIGNTTVASGSTLSAILSIWVSAATGHAIAAVAGSTVLIDGVQFVRSDLATLSTVSFLGNWSIQYAEFNRVSSVLTGTNLASTDYFDKVGLLNTATVTGRTKQLVLDANGVVSEQLIATPPTQFSFNVPIATVYSDGSVPTDIVLKSISGSEQTTQKGLLCNTSSLFNVSQLFSVTVNNGQTINISGRMTFYNLLAITQPNYYVNIQVWGVTTGGQLVNLGTQTQTVLNKDQYAYTNADFGATDTLVTNLIAVGVRAQVMYGQINATALVNTMFAQITIT